MKIAQLEKHIATHPEDHSAFFLLGRELINEAQYAHAAKVFEACIEIEPSYTAAYRHWGDALRHGGDTAAAIEVYKRGIKVSSETGDLQAGTEMRALLGKLQDSLDSEETIA